MAETKKSSAEKAPSARKATRRRSTATGDVPIKTAKKKPLKRVKEEVSVPRQRGVLRECFASLQRVADACHPLSVWNVIGLLVIGAVIGILSFIGILYLVRGPHAHKLRSLQGTNADRHTLPTKQVPEKLSVVDMGEFWQVWEHIERYYVPQPQQYSPDGEGKTTPTRTELVHGAIDGLTQATGDKYTNFFLPKDARDFEGQVIEGEINGIGTFISTKNERLTIIKPIDNGPAQKAGLRANDIIVSINGIDSDTYNISEAADAIRGPRGSTVTLEIYRPATDKLFSIDIVRDRVEIPTIETEVRDGVFVIRLTTFTRQTPQAFREALLDYDRAVQRGQVDRILLDLRGNMGGILSVAVYLAGLFLPEGSPVLYEYAGSERLKVYRSNKPLYRKGSTPLMTILVDGASASAAEILAAALHYYAIADIVGEQTLGKGSIQSLKDIGNRSLLKVTVAHWLTPGKVSIGSVGITPDLSFTELITTRLEEDPDLDVEQYVLEQALQHLMSR